MDPVTVVNVLVVGTKNVVVDLISTVRVTVGVTVVRIVEVLLIVKEVYVAVDVV